MDLHLFLAYPRAECSFFEDLPRFTTDAKLLSAVTAKMGGIELPARSLYVQYDKDTGNAIVLVTKSAKTWTTEIVLTIDGRKVPQEKTLADRVLVSPVPRGFDVNRIICHDLFANRVIEHNHFNDQFILELNNVDNYKYCLDKGLVKIDGTMMEIKPYALIFDPETMDIHAENWYETDMLEIKPDIMTLLHNPQQHPIFHYQWNAQNWIEQLRKLESTQ
ncbi:unnamed protein product [Didymodactylos carnosus]|uniref:Uncharacterized protein n=1 Tax=Didymodactylos carnosus TaxID=1234261 RepID=A0A814QXW8_9BILA|nr:unnamed protein product [Didymodactylos carnosus]CAF1125263.1 unnamed protein product [Didymodactylos carnosus]CAF3832378.1 unnamed protein product [Didymodactylos carnosus]CAF3888803.1 unnamed protein product [Didymodactylos carnosus]